MRIPAASRRNPTNPAKISPSPAKKYRKIRLRSGPGGSPEPPESLREPSGTRRNEENSKNQFLAAKIPPEFFAGTGFDVILGSGREPKIDKKQARERKSASVGGAGSDFLRFFAPSLFGVGLRTDFWTLRPSKCGQIPILSTISRKPRFPKKHRKSTLREGILEPKVAKISAGGPPNRKNRKKK